MALKVEFGNLVVRFGDNKVFVDYLTKIVFPAFEDDELERRYGENTIYFFLNTRIGQDESGEYYISGRIVKDTLLERDQYFDGTKIVEDHESLDSSPTAFFIILLKSHRFIYIHETRYAPPMEAFGATVRKFLNIKHEEFIRELYEEPNNELSLKHLRKIHSKPETHVVSLSSPLEIKEFIKYLKKVNRLELQLLDTNDEIDPEKLYDSIRARKKRLKSEKVAIVDTNPKGLNKTAASNEIAAAAQTGNQRIKIRGEDSAGNRVNGDNDNFKLFTELDLETSNTSELRKKGISIFHDLVESNSIFLPAEKKTVIQKIADALRERNE